MDTTVMSVHPLSAMARRLPPGCIEDVDRHGNVRVYFRAKGCPKVRLRATPWTPEFMVEYDLAKNGVPTKGRDIILHSWRWLCVRYFGECAEYKQLDKRTQHVRRRVLEATFDEPVAPESPRFFRDMPLAHMTATAVKVLRDRKLQLPEAANARVKAIRQVFKWAVLTQDANGKPLALHNPALSVPYLQSTNPSGYHTWTLDEVQQFEQRHPIGTKARLALALLLYTGQRRSDITRLGRQHIHGGKIRLTQFKGRKRKPVHLVLPVLPELQRILDVSPCGDLTLLINELRRPFTDAGFGNKMRQWCNEAGLAHCTAHGLRKAGATIAANNGATSHQLMAIFGWHSLKMAEQYTRKADQQRLAELAMHMLADREQNGTKSGPTFEEKVSHRRNIKGK